MESISLWRNPLRDRAEDLEQAIACLCSSWYGFTGKQGVNPESERSQQTLYNTRRSCRLRYPYSRSYR
ncbi:MAG: hypothetical protein HC866_18075 [Leptolyngbyaceae cyanobacterium RU_5_1]|nr:hypothetical protein [Leptolyngbyaceae cyanobacterium RU_5_1]